MVPYTWKWLVKALVDEGKVGQNVVTHQRLNENIAMLNILYKVMSTPFWLSLEL